VTTDKARWKIRESRAGIPSLCLLLSHQPTVASRASLDRFQPVTAERLCPKVISVEPPRASSAIVAHEMRGYNMISEMEWLWWGSGQEA
jgi:hypothetical protein